MMTIEQSLNKLFSLHQFGIKLGLESTINLLNFLGNPQKNLKCFHIAGSNGKGSTSSFIASILMEAGYKVGLYTSPHLMRFNERIRINGKEISDEFILNFMNKVDTFIDNNSPTFFELTTAMAFKYFVENEVDFAVVETGLGGRLDSTNVINPLAVSITTISLEHTNILGDSLQSIAAEKAAIIKENSKTFVGFVPLETKPIFIDYATQKKSELFFLSDYSAIKNYSLKLTCKDIFNFYQTPLRGIHQLSNAALAVMTLINTFPNIDGLAISKGIKNVIKNSGIQCRYEVFNENPKVIFDSAHNPEGVESFINEFKNEFSLYLKRFLLFGTMKDKDYISSLKILHPYFDEIYVLSIEYERAASTDELIKTAAALGISVKSLAEPDNFIKNFIAKKNSNHCLVALGSIYILGEVKLKLLS